MEVSTVFAASKIIAGIMFAKSTSLIGSARGIVPDTHLAYRPAATVYQLTQIDSQPLPVVVCTDASGATTSVTSGTLDLAGKNKFTLTLNIDKTSGGTTTQQVVTQPGTYSQKGDAITFKVPGVGTFTGTISNGVLTVAGYPYCGATHSLTFQQS